MSKLKIMIQLALLLLITAGFSPKDDFAACKEELKKYVNELGKIGVPSGKRVYYMNMTITTDMSSKSRIPDSEVTVRVYMSATKLHYVSDVLSTYQDEENAFAVLPQRKVIVWSNGGKLPDAKSNMEMVTQLQDTLVSLSNVVSCNESVENGRAMKVLTMTPYKKAMDIFKVNKIEYSIDPNAKRIERVKTYYQPGEDIVMRSITYHELDLNYNKTNLAKSVYHEIFHASGKLLDKYKGYQVIDNRN